MRTEGHAALAAEIAAAYPAHYVSDLTLTDWTTRLCELEPETAARVAQRMRNLSSPPEPWDWRDARRAERTTYVRALPPGAVKLDPLTPEQRERLEAVKAKLKDKPVGRVYPKAFDALPDEVFTKPPSLPANAVCPGQGEVGKRKGRHLVCGLCGDDMDPECVPALRDERKCVALSRSESVR